MYIGAVLFMTMH